MGFELEVNGYKRSCINADRVVYVQVPGVDFVGAKSIK